MLLTRSGSELPFSVCTYTPSPPWRYISDVNYTKREKLKHNGGLKYVCVYVLMFRHTYIEPQVQHLMDGSAASLH